MEYLLPNTCHSNLHFPFPCLQSLKCSLNLT
jgi:hypothetical protein